MHQKHFYQMEVAMKFIVSVLLLLLLVSITASAQDRLFVEVAPGNVSELERAIVEAGDREETIILSTGTFLFKESGLPHITSNVVIQGYPDPMIFEGEGGGPEELLVVDDGAALLLINVELVDFSLSKSGTGLVQNQGELGLTRVQLRNVAGSQVCLGFCTRVMPAIWNGENAELSLDQVSIINSGIVSYGSFPSGGVITNLGEARLWHTQFIAMVSKSIPFSNTGTMTLGFVTLYADSQTKQSLMRSGVGGLTISNSIVSGFDADWCTGTQSLGYNLVDNSECGLTAEGDRMGVAAGLLWRPVETSWSRDHRSPEILTHALVPIPASPAVDSVPNERCGSHNLLGKFRNLDGNGDGIKECDAGAVELLPVTLDEGGINGVYYNPDADGHYITIIDNPYNTLIMWNSFDKDGNQ